MRQPRRNMGTYITTLPNGSIRSILAGALEKRAFNEEHFRRTYLYSCHNYSKKLSFFQVSCCWCQGFTQPSQPWIECMTRNVRTKRANSPELATKTNQPFRITTAPEQWKSGSIMNNDLIQCSIDIPTKIFWGSTTREKVHLKGLLYVAARAHTWPKIWNVYNCTIDKIVKCNNTVVKTMKAQLLWIQFYIRFLVIFPSG